jgi:hypothetical protein
MKENDEMIQKALAELEEQLLGEKYLNMRICKSQLWTGNGSEHFHCQLDAGHVGVHLREYDGGFRKWSSLVDDILLSAKLLAKTAQQQEAHTAPAGEGREGDG